MNKGRRLWTDETGTTRFDPWAEFENWLDKEGLQEAMDDDPLPVVDTYFKECEGEAQTLRLEL